MNCPTCRQPIAYVPPSRPQSVYVVRCECGHEFEMHDQ